MLQRRGRAAGAEPAPRRPKIDVRPSLFGLEGEDIDDAVLYEAWVELWLACGAGVFVLDWVRRQLAGRG